MSLIYGYLEKTGTWVNNSRLNMKDRNENNSVMMSGSHTLEN